MQGLSKGILFKSIIKAGSDDRLFTGSHRIKWGVSAFCDIYEPASTCVLCLSSGRTVLFFIKLSVSSLEEIEAFIQDVSGFTKTVSHIVLSEHSFTHPIQERVKQIEEPEMTVVK